MTINIDELISKVRQIAAERPDVTYAGTKDGCKYDAGTCSDGSTGCIFGQAGISHPDGLAIKDVLGQLKARKGMRRLWCSAVQEFQDRGIAWSRAVRLADERYPLTEPVPQPEPPLPPQT